MTFARSRRAALSAIRPSVAAFIAFGAMAASVPARADTPCTSDGDCTKGFSCQTINESCASATAPTACAPGEACDASTAAPPVCEATGQRLCEPGPCTTDADCASGMACHASTSESCSSPGCADPSQGCSTGVTCTTVTGPSTCVPKYDLPCTVNADCGDHFTCTPNTNGVCEGSVSGDGAPPVTVCTTTPTGTSSCVADTISCNADSECPATWTCDGSSGGALSGCAGVVESVDGAVTTTTCAPTPTPPPTSRYCIPPSYGGALASTFHGSADSSGGSTSGSNQGATPPTTSQGGGSAAAPGSTPTETTPADSAGGCGVGGSASGAEGWFFAAALAFGLTRRRRATALAGAALSRRR